MSDHFNKTTAKTTNDKLFNLKSEKPGKTLLVTEINKLCSDVYLKSVFNNHGPVDRILMINNTSALVEFTNNKIPSDLVYDSKISPFKIGVHDVKLSFSQQSIDEFKSISKPNFGRNITKVLHFLITNAVYSITVDVLNKICSPYGKVARIYIGKKNDQDNSIEALIEFSTDNDAKIVKENLDGNDIYSGCCSLKLSYSKIHKIHVEKNDSESFDYTLVPKTGLLGPPPPDPPVSIINNNNNFQPYLPPIPLPYSIPPMFSPPPPLYSLPYPIPPPYGYNLNPAQLSDKKKTATNINTAIQSCMHYKSDSTIQETVEGVVLFCSNFSSKIKPDNLFNLFCLYGNVDKIKMGLETGQKSAFVQMSNREGSEFCLMLNGITLFNKQLEISICKFTEITDAIPNKDPVQTYYSDFYNRFKSSFSSKSKVFFPSQTLHFFNVPSTFTAEEIADVFISANVKDPSQVVIFPRKNNSQRGSLVTGLIEFDSVAEAIEGVVMVNHTRLLLPQVSHPFHIKLSFSPTRISEQHILRSTGENIPLESDRSNNKRSNNEQPITDKSAATATGETENKSARTTN